MLYIYTVKDTAIFRYGFGCLLNRQHRGQFHYQQTVVLLVLQQAIS